MSKLKHFLTFSSALIMAGLLSSCAPTGNMPETTASFNVTSSSNENKDTSRCRDQGMVFCMEDI